MENIFVVMGVIVSVITFALSLVLVLRATLAEDMKYSKRKELLYYAVYSLGSGVGYWLIVLVIYASAWLRMLVDMI